jgi:hypothetical protein
MGRENSSAADGRPNQLGCDRIGPWGLLVFVAVCSCATGKVAEEKASPPDDLFCDRDDDCEILDIEFDRPRDHREPYAISRAGAERRKARHKDTCANGACEPVGYPMRCFFDVDHWIAICSRHVCERRPAEHRTTAKYVCPEVTPETMPGYPTDPPPESP